MYAAVLKSTLYLFPVSITYAVADDITSYNPPYTISLSVAPSSNYFLA